MRYRHDIDGLRAFAVLFVLLYHLDVPYLKGGFTGVDIFFVISGYVITLSILNQFDGAGLKLRLFYLNRVKRIIPALFTVTALTIFAALAVLPKAELKEFAGSVISVATFTSNFFFWQHSDYFSVFSELKPLLHTWSLGIEEQFYIFFPLLLSLLLRFSKRSMFIWLGLFFFTSFICNIALYLLDFHTANFYLPVPRFWELLLGVFLALSYDKKQSDPIVLTEILTFSGVILIVYALFYLDPKEHFPGANALFPTLGAFILIYVGQNRYQPVVTRYILSGPVKYIGLISYSLYLWHWPLLAITKHLVNGDLTLLMKAVIFFSSILLSIISYNIIEQPCRHNGRYKELLNFKFMAIISLLLVFIASAIYLSAYDSRKVHPERPSSKCFIEKDAPTIEMIDQCSFGAKDSKHLFVLYGDSHANALFPVFEQIADEHGWKGIYISFPGCPPLFDVHRTDSARNAYLCNGTYSKNVEYFLERNHQYIEKVFLVARWAMYENGHYIHGRFQKHESHFLSDEKTASTSAVESTTVLNRALQNTVHTIRHEMGIPVVLLKSPPDLSQTTGSMSRTAYIHQLLPMENVLRHLELQKELQVIDPIDIFCDTEMCKRYQKTEPLYKDDNHVTAFGALKYYPLLAPELLHNNTHSPNP